MLLAQNYWDKAWAKESDGKDLTFARVGGRATKAFPNKENVDFWQKTGPEWVQSYIDWRIANHNWKIWHTPEGAPAVELGLTPTFADIPVKMVIDRVFEVDGELIANEFAPRVHNSGHWTIEGAETSQFENHLRAILDLPLGSTAAVGHAVMVNFIGGKPESEEILKIPNTHLHLYAKAARKGRKIAHATIHTKTLAELEPLKKRLIALADEADDS
jgi:hypothetical protein